MIYDHAIIEQKAIRIVSLQMIINSVTLDKSLYLLTLVSSPVK